MDLLDLKKIGLTSGELKLYGALLDLGDSTRTELSKKSGISPSKIYDVANRLLEKGLISSTKKDGIIHFNSVDPHKIKSFLDQKQLEIEKEKDIVNELLPTLLSKYRNSEEKTEVEVLYGWEGMATAFDDIAQTLKKGDVNYIYGASLGKTPGQVDMFFSRYYKKVDKSGYQIKIIFNEGMKQYKERTGYFEKSKVHKVKYLHQETFSEINVYKNKVLFIILLSKPIIIRIISNEAADSSRKFFETLWEQAKK
ncbi:MAG TPA: helix-turn-helix domain-containing protein [Candidatus Nanoarchaeia archaeon]|nr:helix-turn-helix domain-containing protein [Candidatus Nanoarchaeia archaeon]